MNKYAQFINEKEIYYAPKNYRLPDGRLIVNFNRSVACMVKYGFKLVKDERPIYNYETHYITLDKYVEEGECIRITYKTIKIPIYEEVEQ